MPTPSASELRGILRDHVRDIELEHSGMSHIEPLAEENKDVLAWSVSGILRLFPDVDADDRGGLEWTTSEGVSLAPVVQDANDEVAIRLFSTNGFTVDLYRLGSGLAASLDERSVEAEHFLPLTDPRTGTLVDEIDEEFYPLGNTLLVIERANLAPAWRGLGGLGRMLIAHALRWEAREAKVIAVHPHPIDLPEGLERDGPRFLEGLATVRRTWASLGFDPMDGHEDIWLFDPAMNGMDLAEAKLRSHLLGGS